MSIREKFESLAQKLADKMYDWPVYRAGSSERRPRLVAHRGCWNLSTHMENTIPAFMKARELGAWAVELDVRFTRDNVPVVNHDSTLNRGHGVRGEVAELTWTELHARAPRIPRLTDVLSLTGIHFMVEIKEVLNERQTAALDEALQALKPDLDYHLLSLRPEIVHTHELQRPPEAWILVGDLNMKELLAAAKARPVGGLAGHYVTVNRNVLNEIGRLGMKAGTGFVPSFNLFRREWSRGVTWVFTNDLEKIVRDEKWKSG